MRTVLYVESYEHALDLFSACNVTGHLLTLSFCTDFERVSLNAAEERVLPPEIRIKIVFAQANAGEQEEEMLETDVSLVRTKCVR